MLFVKTIIIWSVLLLGIIFSIILVREILIPFITSFIVAYLFNPIANKLEKVGCARTISSLLIILVFFLAILGSVIFLLPLIYSEFSIVLKSLPQYFTAIQDYLRSEEIISESGYEYFKNMLDKYSVKLLGIVTTFVNNLWLSTITIINIISFIFITPIITFYVIRDWSTIIKIMDKIIPRKHYQVIIEQITNIDKVLSAYIRGQTQVCLILAIFYSIALYFIGLQYSLFIGLFTGIFSFIPYVGFTLGFVLGNLISFFQFDEITMKLVVILVFVVGQILESAVIVPILIGDNIKLHPVWVIFAIFVGGNIGGFTGVLLALPIAAIWGVLVRFALHRYFASFLYDEATEFNSQ